MAVQLPSVVPSATAWQLPKYPVTLQELQSLQLLLLQQTPSTQFAEKQLVPFTHEVPLACPVPHVGVVRVRLQAMPPEQSVFCWHGAVLQVEPGPHI